MKTIEIKNLEKSYGDFHLTIDNFSMESGTVMVLLVKMVQEKQL